MTNEEKMPAFKGRVSKSGGRKYIGIPSVHHDDFDGGDLVGVKKLQKKKTEP